MLITSLSWCSKLVKEGVVLHKRPFPILVFSHSITERARRCRRVLASGSRSGLNSRAHRSWLGWIFRISAGRIGGQACLYLDLCGLKSSWEISIINAIAGTSMFAANHYVFILGCRDRLRWDHVVWSVLYFRLWFGWDNWAGTFQVTNCRHWFGGNDARAFLTNRWCLWHL